MRSTLSMLLLFLGVFVGCSHVQDAKGIPAAVKDIGVIGSDGEVLVNYKRGRYIIVKACDPKTVLGFTPAQARSNCEGKIITEFQLLVTGLNFDVTLDQNYLHSTTASTVTCEDLTRQYILKQFTSAFTPAQIKMFKERAYLSKLEAHELLEIF